MILLSCIDSENGKAIANKSGFEFKNYHYERFSDGTYIFELLENFSQEKVVLYYEFPNLNKQSFEQSAFHVLELVNLINQNNFCSAIIAPFMPFLRQKKVVGASFGLSVFENMKIITYDAHFLHANVISIVPDFSFIDLDVLIVLPDNGAQMRYANCFKQHDVIYGKKTRSKDFEIFYEFSAHDLEKISKRKCLIVDDILDTGKTLLGCVNVVKKMNPLFISAYISHVLCNDFANDLWGLDYLYVCDTIDLENRALKKSDKIRKLNFLSAFDNLRRSYEFE